MSLLDFLFPKRCVGCGKIGKYFCDQCRKTIRLIEENEAVCPVCERLALDGKTHPRCRTRYTPDGLTSFFRYDGVIRKAIKALKYRLVTDLGEEFISLIHLPVYRKSTIVPIPLHLSRLKERGFNQAEIFGQLFAQKLHLPIRTDILQRIKPTSSQAKIVRRVERIKNIGHVFYSIDISDSILLLDDVFTTGATMRAATAELKRHGAKNVWCITIAR